MRHILGKKQKREKNLSLSFSLLSTTLFQTTFLVLSWSQLIVLSLWVILSPLGDGQRMKGQSIAVFLSHSLLPTLLFHCSFLLICFFWFSKGLPWAMVPLGEHLLQHGLIYVPRFLCCGASPSALAVVSLPSFSLHQCPLSRLIPQRCHQGGWWAQLSPGVGPVQGWLGSAVLSTGQPQLLLTEAIPKPHLAKPWQGH